MAWNYEFQLAYSSFKNALTASIATVSTLFGAFILIRLQLLGSFCLKNAVKAILKKFFKSIFSII